MVCKVFSCEGKSLAKTYSFVEGRVKTEAKPGRLFSSQKPRIQSLEDIEKLFCEGSGGEYALSYFSGKGTHTRKQSEVTSQPTRVLLLDVEWPKPEGFSWPGCALGDIAQYVLVELGLPIDTGCLIRPSPSNGVVGYKEDEPFRYHFALLLEEAVPFATLYSFLEDTGIAGIVDSSIYNSGSLLFVAEGLYGPGVIRTTRSAVHLQAGPTLLLKNLREAKPLREPKTRRKAQRLAIDPDIPEGALDVVTSSFAKQRPEESNLSYYTAIQHAVYRFGNATQTIRWLQQYEPERRSLEDLQAKERNALEKIPEISNYFWKEYRAPLKNVLDVEKPESERVGAWLKEKPLEGLYLCNWSEGSGKSTNLIQKVLEKETASSVLYCCHRRAPCLQMSEEHPRLENYQKIKKEGDFAEVKSLSICLPSLRYLEGRSFDVVILDEAEQQLFEIFQEKAAKGFDFSERDKEREQSKTKFENLLSLCMNARAVIAMDASATGLLGHFLTTLSVLREGHSPLHLLSCDFDWLRLKEVSITSEAASLLEGMSKETGAFVLHTSFSNDFGQMSAWSHAIQETLGLSEREVFLLDGSSNDQIHHDFKRNPDEVIPRLLEKGVKVFILSPAVSTGFSYKGEGIDSVYAIFQNSLFGCYDIKQTISRFRKAKRVTVAITAKKYSHREYGEKDSENAFERLRHFASKKELLEKTNLFSAFIGLLKERKIPFRKKEEPPRKEFQKILQKNTLTEEKIRELKEKYEPNGIEDWADYLAASKHEKTHLFQMMNFFTFLESVAKHGKSDFDEKSLRKCLLSFQVVSLVLGELIAGLHQFIEWYLLGEEEISFSGEEVAFEALEDFIESHREELEDLMIPLRKGGSWRSYLKQTCEFFFLECHVEEAPSFKAAGTTRKGLAQNVIQEMKNLGIRINKTGTVSELEARIDENLKGRANLTVLQKQYIRHRFPLTIIVRKRTLTPRAKFFLSETRKLAQIFDNYNGLPFDDIQKGIEEYFLNHFHNSLLGQEKFVQKIS